jgi:hypothetical protein
MRNLPGLWPKLGTSSTPPVLAAKWENEVGGSGDHDMSVGSGGAHGMSAGGDCTHDAPVNGGGVHDVSVGNGGAHEVSVGGSGADDVPKRADAWRITSRRAVTSSRRSRGHFILKSFAVVIVA